MTGTKLVVDLRAGAAASAPQGLAVAPGYVCFSADDGTRGREPYASDGSSAGTRILGDLAPGLTGSFAFQFTGASDRVYFAARVPNIGIELAVTDSTAAGTKMIDVIPGSLSLVPERLATVGDRAYFVGRHPTLGVELYSSDGTVAGTQLFCDLTPGSATSFVAGMTVVDGELYFSATDGILGEELYVIRLPGATATKRAAGSASLVSTLDASLPRLGTTANLRYAEGPAGHVGVMTLSAPRRPYTVAGLVRAGAPLLVDLGQMIVLQTVAAPSGSVPLAIPNATPLVGVRVHVQNLWVNVQSVIPVEVSNAVHLRLGR